jgi:putative SOS response-associated peptidase YedK
MCGRIIQASGLLRYALVDGLDLPDTRMTNFPPRFNGAPGQDLLVIRQNPKTAERSLDPIRWGFVPRWTAEPKPKARPINAKAEGIARSHVFSDAYAARRCIVPVDGFFEWRSIKGKRQPYAIAMADRSPFGLAGVWDNWKDPASGEWLRTFAVITVPANALVATIHDRMPAILKPADYERWLGPDRDPRDALAPFPAEQMIMWPVSQRVNSWQNDDAALVEPVELEQSA